MTACATITECANRRRRCGARPGYAARAVAGLAARAGCWRSGARRPRHSRCSIATNQDQVPQGTELAAPDAQDLRHQLQIVNGLAAPAGGGWTFVPRIDFQEMLTDNVLEAAQPATVRIWSLIISPGFSLVGDLPRLSTQPRVMPHAGDLYPDRLAECADPATERPRHWSRWCRIWPMSMSGRWPACRACIGGVGGLGAVGAIGAGATAQTAAPTLAGNAQGLNRNNEVQTRASAYRPICCTDSATGASASSAIRLT